jgi:RHS repeat-associated protein
MDHDGAGNITQDVRSGSGTYAYTMNHRNRLAAASVGGTQVGTYVYDALERLAIRTTSNVTPAGTTHFAYDLSGKVLIEANGANGATVREYVWFNDMPLAIVANVDTASPQLLHVHADHLDRPIMLTSTSKANVWEAVYRPFGEVHAITGTATQNLRFPGQYFLFETGLAHNWHRTYDATIGRYLQADPLGLVGGRATFATVALGVTIDAHVNTLGTTAVANLNPDAPTLYSYAKSTPIRSIDPTGLVTQLQKRFLAGASPLLCTSAANDNHRRGRCIHVPGPMSQMPIEGNQLCRYICFGGVVKYLELSIGKQCPSEWYEFGLN